MKTFLLSCLLTLPLAAQAPASAFRDTYLLKPPAGAKVALFEFEDLECPLCAHDYAIVRGAIQKYGVAFVRHDLPLTEIHVWSFTAAVTARYLEDKVSPAAAELFRRDVFANQRMIASRDDLDTFTRRWFAAHSLALPFVLDPSGRCTQEVAADRTLADRLNIHKTPCLFVVTQNRWVEVESIDQLYTLLDAAQAETRAMPPAAKPRTPAAKH